MSTLLDALDRVVAARGDALAVRDREGAVTYTWTALRDAARRVAGGLAGLGVGAGDGVGLLIDDRPEFHVADLAVVTLGAVPVSIYNTSASGQIAYIIDDAEVKVLITQASYAEVARAAIGDRPIALVVLEEDSWASLGQAAPAAPAAVTADDLLTIIYTSGTTGPPKGVELTHANLMTATATVGAFNGLALTAEGGGRVICWLPLAHIAERIASYYAAIAFGLEVTTCADARQVGATLREVRPTWFFAVPRIWEKLRAGAMAAEAAGMPREQLPAALGLDAVQVANIGAAPSAPELITYFHELGVPLAEIYGMSENCACCTCNPPSDIRIGTVGPALPGTELRIAEDGEVLMRSATVMRGYRNNPEATAEAIDSDGWLHTGDVGALDDAGYLRIVDRKKEIIINSAGKNMSPSAIEATIKTHSPLIGQICVVGDRRSYNVALIVLDPDVLGERDPFAEEVRTQVAGAIAAGNARLSRVEQVKRYEILDAAWAPGGDELTPTLKLKRSPIAAKYASVIEDLYAEVPR